MRKFLYLTVFISGMTSLAIEMAASRLVEAYFGTSNLVWASIIGLILVYLSVGYFIGGFLADRRPKPAVFFIILAAASIATALVPAASRPILQLSAAAFDKLDVGVLFGAFTAVMVLLFIPITLLGMASPFAIRLAVQDSRQIGSVSGRIYAISTLGSFIGTFLPGLILIPLIGTYRTFLVFAGVLLVTSLIGLGLTGSRRLLLSVLWSPLLIGGLWLWGGQGWSKNTEGLIYEKESAYNYIQVLQKNDFTLLRLNEGQGVHSIYHPTQTNYYGPWEQVLAAPYFNPAPYPLQSIQRIAIVGLAAGTTARQATLVYGPIPIDGYEIDPEIIQVGRDYFGMNLPNLNVFAQDGRWGLAHSPHTYQIISVDAYRPPYIPFHLTTREFFKIVRDHLTPDGVMTLNIGRSPTDRGLVNTLSSTALSCFASVHVIDIPGTFNSIVIATAQPTSDVNLKDNLAYLSNTTGVHPLLLDTLKTTAQNIQPAPPGAQVFTDDLAPIEWLTNKMVLSYVFSEQGSK